MTQSRIRILSSLGPGPQIASLPIENARRWISPYEFDGNRAFIPVFFSRNAYEQAVSHAASNMEVEVGGVLVGRWCADSATGQQFIIVSATLPARFTHQGSIYLTFTQDSLVDIHAKIDEMYPDEVIVGWYHTHPRMGVFLSQYDTWLHNHFFPEPWQVALVIEPYSAVGGFFIRKEDGLLDPVQYFGFYEMGGNSGRSSVGWNNLQHSSTNDGSEGVDFNE
jgi:proteasome lid subunit RPN8/RPN11